MKNRSQLISSLRRLSTPIGLLPAVTTALMTAIFGQIYFRPFYNDFRLSMGVVAFSILLYMYDRHWSNVLLTGAVVGLFRVLLGMQVGIGFAEAIQVHYPAVLYYWIFGVLFYLLGMKERLEKPLQSALLLMGADVLSNLAELLIRGEYNPLTIEVKIQNIVIYGLFRSVMALTLYFVIRFYPELLDQHRRKRQFYQRVIDYSRLSNEVVFLSKSENEIEHAMSEAFELYQLVKAAPCDEGNAPHDREGPSDNSLRHRTLNLSRSIHDIKKDYKRIRAGLESMIPQAEALAGYELQELLQVFAEDLMTQAKQQSKAVDVQLMGRIFLKPTEIYPVIGILSNLAVNAIEAFEREGIVRITLKQTGEWVSIEVLDDGPGIPEENRPLLFEPGYSTKYDASTGKMSTGMGLSQVKYLTEQILNGELAFESAVGTGTRFHITFRLASH